MHTRQRKYIDFNYNFLRRALCDTNQSGKLTLEQFALAMWLVERKQKGIDPPQVLTANMVPPSMRAIVAGVDLQPQVLFK